MHYLRPYGLGRQNLECVSQDGESSDVKTWPNSQRGLQRGGDQSVWGTWNERQRMQGCVTRLARGM